MSKQSPGPRHLVQSLQNGLEILAPQTLGGLLHKSRELSLTLGLLRFELADLHSHTHARTRTPTPTQRWGTCQRGLETVSGTNF